MKQLHDYVNKLLVTFSLILTITMLVQAQANKTEILWDNYGVPHIYANTDAGMHYASGWAQMHSHANLVLQLYAQARGRAAEYFGKKYLLSDRQMHLFNLPEQAKKNYAAQTPLSKSHLDAFVTGINAYATAHPENIAKEFLQVLPITPFDVLAHGTRVISLEFLARADIARSVQAVLPGSNAIAIGPSRSASKNAMLMTNPHLPWSDFFTFYEGHVNAPGYSAYGVWLIGLPELIIAFNQNLGWTHTVNTIDASDRYELTLKDGGYVLDGNTIPFEKKNVVIKVKQDDGIIKDEKFENKYSKHGPVIGEKNGKAYAVRVTGLENAFMGEQYYKMGKAKNLAEFESALKMLQNPMFNVIYADKAGNIMYLFNGNIPVRTEGDFQFWNGTIDGTTSKYIWTKTHTYNDLPKVLNPATGFVHNANDPPWLSTYPAALDSKKFPGYMSPVTMALRPQNGVKMLLKDSSITFDELVEIKLNTNVEAADRFLDDLFLAFEQHPDTATVKAIAVLKSWDKKVNAESKGAILFEQWYNKLNIPMLDKVWNVEAPLTTPDGFKDQKKIVELLVQAAGEVETRYGAVDVAYGEVNRFRSGDIDLPANGGSDRMGLYRVMGFTEDKDKKRRAIGGDTYVSVTEFGKKVRANVLLSYGNASQPGSKHSSDQLKLLSENKLRPALLDRSDIMKNLEKKETLIISNKK